MVYRKGERVWAYGTDGVGVLGEIEGEIKDSDGRPVCFVVAGGIYSVEDLEPASAIDLLAVLAREHGNAG